MLKLKNICKTYPQRGKVLDNLGIEVKKGDTVAITGPSGSGKTTFLNIIGLLDNPDSGEVWFNGTDLTSLGQDDAAIFRHENIGFVFQDHLLLPYLTVIENIELPLLASSKRDSNRDELKEYISNLMEKCDIQGLGNKYPSQISGGEAQRATLVRALANRPQLILADEPTGSLDKDNSDRLADLLTSINNDFETTIITVTHSAVFANSMDVLYELNSGLLVPVKGNK